MKKIFFIFVILTILLFLPLISSAEIKFVKEDNLFDQGETLISVISGNFIDQVTRENILFFHDHERIPMTFDVKKYNNEFYVYALLTNKPSGNYSIVIRNVRYIIGTETFDEDITRSFVISGNTADFSVNPGVIETSGNFSIEVMNLKAIGLTISVDLSDFFSSENSVELVSGDVRQINFQLIGAVTDSEKFFKTIRLTSDNTSYDVPVLIESSESQSEDHEKQPSFKFEPASAEVSLATNSDSSRIIYLSNTGTGSINDITFSVSQSLLSYVRLSPDSISSLNEGSALKLEIFINSSEDEISGLEGIITANSGELSTSFTLGLNFIKDFFPDEGTEDKKIITTCSQLRGSICERGERCSGETNSAKDGACCLAPGICEEIPERQTGKIIGWGIIIFILILLFWFFKKYKKARPSMDILSMGKSKK